MIKTQLAVLLYLTSSFAFAYDCKNCFPNLEKASKELSEALAKNYQDQTPFEGYEIFLDTWSVELHRSFREVEENIISYPAGYTDYKLIGFAEKLTREIKLTASRKSELDGYPSLSYSSNNSEPPASYQFSLGSGSEKVQFTEQNETFCHAHYQSACGDVLRGLEASTNAYKKALEISVIGKMLPLVKFHDQSWTEFYTKSRSQTFTDLLLQTYFDKERLIKPEFVSPSEKQYFMLHPSVVVENVSDALDGQQVTEGLALEWIGINWWRQCPLLIGIACGVSVISLFSDRAGVDDFGHGIMLHFANKYSIGFTDHNGSEGVFITADLLKAFENKNERLQAWKTKTQDLLSL